MIPCSKIEKFVDQNIAKIKKKIINYTSVLYKKVEC